jgi:hypothetical protein
MPNSLEVAELDQQNIRQQLFHRFLPFLFLLVSAVIAILTTNTVARIEDKYFQTHRVFLDPAVYQEHLFKLWLASHEKSRFELAWLEFANPPVEGIPPLAFRTVPLLLLNPDWLRNPHAHLITSGFSLFIFLFLVLHTVNRRTRNFVYAFAVAVLIGITPGIYGPIFGLGAFWLDLTAGFLGAAAILCLINSEQGKQLIWLGGFAVLAALSLLSRFVTGAYLFVQAAPILFIYLLMRWRRTKSFAKGVVGPATLVGGILFVLIAWYVWRQAPAQSFYYTQESYDSLSILASLQFVLSSVLNFLSNNLAIFCGIVFGFHLILGIKVRWHGLLDCVWPVVGAGLVLTLACQIAVAPYAVEYIVPILLFALLCPIDWSSSPSVLRRSPLTTLARIIVPLAVLLVALVSLDQTLHNSLWRPPKPTPQEADRKSVNDRLTDAIIQHYPDKVIGAYFDQFDEYAFVTAFERYGRTPLLLPNRTFDIRAEYLQARFPKKTPKELADTAWREAVDKCDIVLVFNDPAAAFTPAPFDYGWCLNPYSEEIASRLAQRVRDDSNWKKLFVAPSKYLPGGVAAYANLSRFPDAAATSIK